MDFNSSPAQSDKKLADSINVNLPNSTPSHEHEVESMPRSGLSSFLQFSNRRDSSDVIRSQIESLQLLELTVDLATEKEKRGVGRSKAKKGAYDVSAI